MLGSHVERERDDDALKHFFGMSTSKNNSMELNLKLRSLHLEV